MTGNSCLGLFCALIDVRIICSYATTSSVTNKLKAVCQELSVFLRPSCFL